LRSFTGIVSAKGCQDRCTQVRGCDRFNFYLDGNCELLPASNSQPLPNYFAIAGPRKCGVEPNCSYGNTVNPPEENRSYSSIDGGVTPHSMLNSSSVWQPKKSSSGEWMQIDLGRSKRVYGIVTQGRNTRWVTRYEVDFSSDGKMFHRVDQVFQGNADSEGRVQGVFPYGVTARYLRIYPVQWHGAIGMRAAVMICQEEISLQLEKVLKKVEAARQKKERARAAANAKLVQADNRARANVEREEMKGRRQENSAKRHEAARAKKEAERQRLAQKEIEEDKAAVVKLQKIERDLKQQRAESVKKLASGLKGYLSSEASGKNADSTATAKERSREAKAGQSESSTRTMVAGMRKARLSLIKTQDKNKGNERLREGKEAAMKAAQKKTVAEALKEEREASALSASSRKAEAARAVADSERSGQMKGAIKKVLTGNGKAAEAQRQKAELGRAQRTRDQLQTAQALANNIKVITNASTRGDAARKAAEERREKEEAAALSSAKEALKKLKKAEASAQKQEVENMKKAAKRLKGTKKAIEEARAWSGEAETSRNEWRGFEAKRRRHEVERQVQEEDRRNAELDREQRHNDVKRSMSAAAQAMHAVPPGHPRTDNVSALVKTGSNATSVANVTDMAATGSSATGVANVTGMTNATNATLP